MKPGKPIYIAQTQPGFEGIVADQLEQGYEGIAIRGTRTVPDKNGMVLFSYAGGVNDLLELRTIEDLFILVLSRSNLAPTYAGLKELKDNVANLRFDDAVSLARQIQPGRGGRGKLRYRVIARQANRASYRRIDAQEAVEKGIAARPDRKWQLAEDGGLEFWLTMLPDETLLALRLSDEKMRHREEKREHLPASLRPSAAAALVWLARPRPDDVFLDPMCGAGTLLIERARVGRYRLLLGGDIREEAVAVTQQNIGTRFKPIEVRQWDARDLPLDEAAVSSAAVNLPFGRQIGSAEQNRSLYPAFLREMARVVRPAGRIVALTADTRTFESAFQRSGQFEPGVSYPVQVLGQRAKVYVMRRM